MVDLVLENRVIPCMSVVFSMCKLLILKLFVDVKVILE